MDANKQAAVQHMKTTKVIGFFLGLLGVPTGYALSYCFQGGLVRSFCSLGRYFQCIGDVFTKRETAPAAIITTSVVTLLFGIAATLIVSRAQVQAAAVLDAEEMQQYTDASKKNSRIWAAVLFVVGLVALAATLMIFLSRKH